MTGPDPQELRRLLHELAGAAPMTVDRESVDRLAFRRRAVLLSGAASAVAACGVVAAVTLQPTRVTDTLEPPTRAVQPTQSQMPTSTPSPTITPSATPRPTATSQAEPSATATPVPSAPTRPAGLPTALYAAQGSRIGAYRSSDGARTSWLSPEQDGYGAGNLALWDKAVLYGLGNDETRGVYAIGRVPSPENGPGSLSDPGGSSPAVLPDGSRHAFLASGDDAAYAPRSPDDLRLVLTQELGGVQAVNVATGNMLGGLTFASPDRLVLAVDPSGGKPEMGLQLYDFQTDEADLGSRTPDERFLPAPAGCSWSLPTATPTPDEVLVLQRCNREDGGDSDAVVVDVTSGEVVATFGTVRRAGPGQVDSLDLDRTGKHLIAQIHDGGLPPAPGSSTGGEPDGPVLVSRSLPGGRTVTTTTSLVSPVWD